MKFSEVTCATIQYLVRVSASYTVRQLASHLLQARRWSSFHSPYLFDLFTYCCDNQIQFEAFGQIEQVRKQWLRTTTTIQLRDYGAGSDQRGHHQVRSVLQVAKHALSSPFQCRFMSRLARFCEPKSILELGTSLGISASYLHAGQPAAAITTIEGDPELAKLAQQTFDRLNMNTIQLVESTFEDYILKHKTNPTAPDLIFLDGNHRSSALLEYVNALKQCFSTQTIVIVDDLYWSADMTEGWKQLIQMPEVTQSVDCFAFGLLFFRAAFQAKEHHRIRLPWRALLNR